METNRTKDEKKTLKGSKRRKEKERKRKRKMTMVKMCLQLFEPLPKPYALKHE